MVSSQAPAREAASAGGPVSISWMIRLPITIASAWAAIARALAEAAVALDAADHLDAELRAEAERRLETARSLVRST